VSELHVGDGTLHTGRPFNEEVFAACLDFRPVAISFHMGIQADLVARAHDRDILWLQTVGDTEGAEAALAADADVLIAQGTEAGGNAGWIGTLVLVPLVVDLAGEVPVVAAGGIADGRGIAAALALAQGASIGTGFLGHHGDGDRCGVEGSDRLGERSRRGLGSALGQGHAAVHSPSGRPPLRPRALRTPLIDQLENAPATVDRRRRIPSRNCDQEEVMTSCRSLVNPPDSFATSSQQPSCSLSSCEKPNPRSTARPLRSADRSGQGRRPSPIRLRARPLAHGEGAARHRARHSGASQASPT
jgi:NAD(P)H-dependent flavin oxidoreductase YrpB (nitropropane dioxygenase family)